MVGNFTPELEEVVRACAESAGCSDRLSLFPWAGREEIDKHYRQATVTIFPSIWDETLGIVGLESLSCGVPVVASDVGGVREWLLDDVTGLLVSPQDSAAIAAAANRLLRSPEENFRMGTAGIEWVNQKFSAVTHARSLIEEYETAASGAVLNSIAAG